MTYQWQKNGANIFGAIFSTYIILPVNTNAAGIYSVKIVNSGGSVISSSATLTVLVPPTITTQPQSEEVAKNDATSFSVSASGTAPLHYQWRLNGADLTRATSSTLTLSQVKSGNVGNYTVVVTNFAGSATSAVAVLTMDAPPFILTQPQNQTVNLGQNASFSVGAIGLAPVTYQWTFDGADLAGATSSTLTLSNIQTSNAGNYNVVLANDQGSVTSSNATLTLNPLPGITTQPFSQTEVAGQNVSFFVGASGKAPFSYQWYFNGTNLSGATNPLLTITNFQTARAGSYSVVVTNTAGAVTSVVATLTLITPPTITNPPASQMLVAGQNAAFAVAASGSGPLNYQWSFNGTDIASGTNALLTLTNIQTTDAGSYSVVVTNLAGSATSTVATLKVFIPPTITTQPRGLAVSLSQPAKFSVGATGTALLGYQWCFKGTVIAGATDAVLALTGVHLTDAGDYSVVVTNSVGSVTSLVATLSVTNPVITLVVANGAGMTASGFAFQLLVPVGITYVIEATTNLQDWKPIFTNVALTESISFEDPAATNYGQRLYRAVVP